ncbi:MAG: DEAD/DEAH box helicase, partial [Streptomyces sp.]|nr:DEAD/DEAH box helicase [Streptomyces sp.]
AGRWSLLPAHEADPTVRAHALARTLLDRHGVVTRGAVAAEGVEGGFSATYRILSAFEDSGQARRGYVVEGLGAAQFAMDGAVDRLRAVANARERGEPLPAPGAAAGPGTGNSHPNGFAGGSEYPLAPAGTPGTGLDPFGGPNSTFGYGGPPDAPAGAGGRDDLADPFATGVPDAFDTGRALPEPLSAPGFAGARPGSGFSAADSGSRSPYAQGLPPNRTRSTGSPRAVVLAAADPANAYGSALPWPEPPTGAGHKPGRKAGSLVVLVDGELVLYMERGGKTLLAWPSAPQTGPTEDARLRTAAEALAAAARAGSLGTVTVERVNGVSALSSPFGILLEGAGFIATPRGLRIRA